MTSLQAISGTPSERIDAAAVLLEARADPRVGVDFPVQIYSRDFSGPISAAARDLSIGGVCIATSSLLSFKAINRIRLALAGGPLELTAVGRWQCEGIGGAALLGGISFVDPEREEVARLWDMVHGASKEMGLFLYSHSDLNGMRADDAMTVAECSRFLVVRGRRRIYVQDEHGPGTDSIFFVLRGTVTLNVRLNDRREITLERLSSGCVFGGLPMVAGLANCESAVADDGVKLLELSQGTFSYLRIARPMLAQHLAKLVIRTQLRRARKLTEIASGL